jgi:hypothetical protein
MSQTSTATELQSYLDTSQPIAQPFTAYTKSHGSKLSIDDMRPINAFDTAVAAELLETPDKKTTAIVLLTVVCVTMIGSITSGVVIVALPTIAKELGLGPEVLLWYFHNLEMSVASADPIQANLDLFSHLRLYVAPDGLHRRRRRLTAHVPDRLLPAILFHPRLWPRRVQHPDYRVPRLCWDCYLVLSSVSSEHHH